MGTMDRVSLEPGSPAPLPPPLRTEKDITATWVGSEPVVSVLCATYNHEEFIDDAMMGFLGQETTFPFEIIVRDDASTDKTVEILRQYEDRYPSIVRIIEETTNTYSHTKPFDALRPHARGQFIAVCEGDDYWFHPQKLQDQVHHLTNHPECVLVHHQAVEAEGGEITLTHSLPQRHQANVSGRSLQRGGRVVTNSIMHRNIALDSHPLLSRVWNGDQILLMRLGYHGMAHYLPGPPKSVYRIHGGGVWSKVSSGEQAIHLAESFFWIAHWFAENGDYGTAAYCLRRSVLALIKGFAPDTWRKMAPFPLFFRLISILNFRRGLEWFQRVTR